MKHWWESKTIWFNVGLFLIIFGTEFMVVADLIPEDYRDIARITLTTLTAAGNVILRSLTDKGIK